jgi:hypothetical protein
MIAIDIGAQFSDTPAGRFRGDGEYSGEAFRDDVLLPALRAGEVVEVILDNTEGFGSSFLEEAFGGLVRVHSMDKRDILSRLKFVSEDRYLIKDIVSYIKEAENG